MSKRNTIQKYLMCLGEEIAEESIELEEWLSIMDLQKYEPLFVDNGFDLRGMVEQMGSRMPLHHNLLKRIGIKRHGHRARILVKLEIGMPYHFRE